MNPVELNGRQYRLPSRQTVVICADGCDPAYIEAGLAAGVLPTIAKWRDRGFYALALDGGKEPVATLTSNIGHLLWSGIVMDERVEAVVAHGGRVVQPLGVDAPELTARFADPDGNVLGLYQEPNQSAGS